MGTINCIEDYEQAKIWKAAQEFTSSPSIGNASSRQQIVVFGVQFHILSNMTSMFQLLLQLILSLTTTVAPCNPKDSRGGVLHPYERRGCIDLHTVGRKENTFELNVACLHYPFFHGCFLFTILKTTYFYKDWPPGALSIHGFILYHIT